MEKWENETTYSTSEILDNSWPSTTFSDRTMDHSFEVEQPITCFLCQMKFTDIDKLLEHQVMHIYELSEKEIQTQQEYFDCKICGRSFRCELELNNHHIRFHASHLIRKDIEAEERYKSDQCDNEHINFNYLQQHMKSEPSLLTIKDDDHMISEHKPTIKDDDHMISELKPSLLTIKDDDHMISELKPSVITIEDDDHIKSEHKPSVITIEDDDHIKSELKPSVITIEDDDHIKFEIRPSVIKDDEDDSIGEKVPRMIIKRAKMKYPPRWPFCNPNLWLSSADVI